MVNEKLKLPESDIVNLFTNDKMTRFAISKLYNVDYHVISEILGKYNLLPVKRQITKLSSEDTDKIVSLYKEGVPPKKIKGIFNIGLERIKRIILKNGIEINKTGRKRQYSVNEDYFQNIDTKEKAMFFGLFFADGYNHQEKGCVSLGLAEYDLRTVELFAKAIGSNHPINIYKREKNGRKHNNAAVIVISSKKLSNDLASLGCVQRKSLIKEFPKLASEELIKSFIYGYFLGNGCLHKRIGKKSYVHRFSIASNYRMCLEFKRIFSAISVNSTLVKDKKTSFSKIQVAGNYQVKRLMDWLFVGETDIMERKTNQYNNFVIFMENKASKENK